MWSLSLQTRLRCLCREHTRSVPWWDRSFAAQMRLLQNAKLTRWDWDNEGGKITSREIQYTVIGETVTAKFVNIFTAQDPRSNVSTEDGSSAEAIVDRHDAMITLHRPTYAPVEKHRYTNHGATTHTKHRKTRNDRLAASDWRLQPRLVRTQWFGSDGTTLQDTGPATDGAPRETSWDIQQRFKPDSFGVPTPETLLVSIQQSGPITGMLAWTATSEVQRLGRCYLTELCAHTLAAGKHWATLHPATATPSVFWRSILTRQATSESHNAI
jgi:hypothetical protein